MFENRKLTTCWHDRPSLWNNAETGASYQAPTSLLLPWGVSHIPEAGLELSFGSVTGHDPWPLGEHWEAAPLRVLDLACMALYRRWYTDSLLSDCPLTVFMDAFPYRIRRTQSGNFNTDAPGMAEFRRGGLRATAGPRLSRTRDPKGQKR